MEKSNESLYLHPVLKVGSKEFVDMVSKSYDDLKPYVELIENIPNRRSDLYRCFELMVYNHLIKNQFFYGLYLKVGNKRKKLIGCFCAYKLNKKNNEIEIGYFLDKDFIGKGYAQPALKKYEKFLVENGFKRIIIHVDRDNLRSIKFAEKNEFSLVKEDEEKNENEYKKELTM